MNFTFSSEQRLFAQTVREFLEKSCTPANAREGFSMERWNGLAGLGVINMLASSEKGGLGLDERDLVLILEESGRVALPEPIVETALVATPLGVSDVIATFADSTLVPHADIADVILLRSHDELHAVPKAQVLIEPAQTIDRARSVARVTWTPSGETRLQASFEDAFDRAAFGTAAQLLGVASRLIEMACEYALQRNQFGKPIGSFQAIKHKLADAQLKLEFSRPVVYRAADSLARDVLEKSRDVSIAKAFASDAATHAAGASLQTLGAIGYTQEHDLHLWLKRAWSLANACGTADFHRERVSKALLGDA
ncbi:MAG: acyl-CoA dehydrogenase family protein [Actinomycetota bacterium]